MFRGVECLSGPHDWPAGDRPIRPLKYVYCCVSGSEVKTKCYGVTGKGKNKDSSKSQVQSQKIHTPSVLKKECKSGKMGVVIAK